MTILSDAQQIRDEVIPRANTATRVGNWMVSVANALSGGSTVSSAGFYSSGGELVTDGDSNPVPMEEDNAGFVSYTTGSGISVTYGSGCYYFSGLSASNVYQVSYSFRITSDELTANSLVVRADNLALAYTKLFIQDNTPVSGEHKSASFTGQISGVTTCVLFAEVSAQCVIDDINASIISLGAAV
jgi:hypothetical protein